jgi:hypothetical protein
LIRARAGSGTIRRGTPPKHSRAWIGAPFQSAVVWRRVAQAQVQFDAPSVATKGCAAVISPVARIHQRHGLAGAVHEQLLAG